MILNKKKYSFIKIENEKYSKLIYNINNSESSRRFSKNNKLFSFSSHKNWLKKVLKNKIEKIFLVKFENLIIGIIREKLINKKNYLSWVVKKNYRKKNHGKKMLKIFIELMKKKYYASIHIDNTASLKMSAFASFKKIHKRKQFITLKIK